MKKIDNKQNRHTRLHIFAETEINAHTHTHTCCSASELSSFELHGSCCCCTYLLTSRRRRHGVLPCLLLFFSRIFSIYLCIYVMYVSMSQILKKLYFLSPIPPLPNEKGKPTATITAIFTYYRKQFENTINEKYVYARERERERRREWEKESEIEDWKNITNKVAVKLNKL